MCLRPLSQGPCILSLVRYCSFDHVLTVICIAKDPSRMDGINGEASWLSPSIGHKYKVEKVESLSRNNEYGKTNGVRLMVDPDHS